MEFLARHDALYETASERLRSATRGAHVLEWLEETFGRRNDREFVVIAALLNGGGNYGAEARDVPSGR